MFENVKAFAQKVVKSDGFKMVASGIVTGLVTVGIAVGVNALATALSHKSEDAELETSDEVAVVEQSVEQAE